MKAFRFVAASSLVAFASLLSCMRQSLHSLVRIHHLLHPSLALLLCFRSLPSEPQVGVYDPVLLMATVLQSLHGLARVWIVLGANHCLHLLDCTNLLLLPLSTLWSVACTSFLDCAPSLFHSPRSSFPFPYSWLLTFSHRILHRIQSVPSLHHGTKPQLACSVLVHYCWTSWPSCRLPYRGRFNSLMIPLLSLTFNDGGGSLQRTRKSKAVGGEKGKAAIKIQTKKTTKAVKV